jgi:hypothetical protein
MRATTPTGPCRGKAIQQAAVKVVRAGTGSGRTAIVSVAETE